MGIAHPRVNAQDVMVMRDTLLSMEMNPYQIVALCVAAQFTSSLILPLAMFYNQISLPQALEINNAEERHNITESGQIEGYHDIREADAVVKICACATTWKMMKHISLSTCLEGPRVSSSSLTSKAVDTDE